ncbi:peptidoglycan DD-metalloendopeptidase family protein [Pseudomonas aeruginosa]
MFFRLLLIAVLLAVSACSSKAPGPGASVPKVVRGEYRVKRGDTLYSIATRHGWNYKDLARANGIRPPYAVKVGQVVRFDGRKSTYVASSRSSSNTRARKPPPPPPSVTLRGWQWPMKGLVIRRFSSSDKLNKGIRIAGTLGQPVQASLAGKVVFAVNNMRGYGNLVIIQHGTSYTSTYAHNSRLLVKEGQMVGKGQKIAEAGSSDADRVQLYFEIRQNGRPLDPLSLLPPS